MKKIIAIQAILMCFSTALLAGTQLTLSPSLLYFHYTEFSQADEVLDRETGWLPGFEAKINHSINPDWSVGIYSAFYQGTVNYDGQTQSGSPHTTRTDTTLLRLGGRIEKNIINNLHLFIGAQLHKWQRDILDSYNVSGLDETYKWTEYSLGLHADIFINQQNLLTIEASFLITRNGTLDVDLSRANLGFASLDLGNDTGGRLNLNWKKPGENNTHYSLSLFFEAWDFGRSNTKLTQGGSADVLVTEPGSETRNAGLQLNIEYYF